MNLINDYAIFLAKNSVVMFQKDRLIRGVCRGLYRTLANLYCALSSEYIRRQGLIGKGVIVDTYPWPYCEEWFADWVEVDTMENYSLVSDNAGFVVKHSTSYCAWKINEFTGSWPTRPRYMMDCSAVHWHRLLFHNNYRNTVKRPEPGKKYIGIMPSYSKYGEVVWYEGFEDGFSVDTENDTGGKIVYSTYRDKKYTIGAAPAEWYIWVEITSKKSA